MCLYMYMKGHGGARQASDPWTVAVSSLLDLISREHCFKFLPYVCPIIIIKGVPLNLLITHMCMLKRSKITTLENKNIRQHYASGPPYW